MQRRPRASINGKNRKLPQATLITASIKTSCVKYPDCAGSDCASKSIMDAGFSIRCLIPSAILPESADTKKVCTIMNIASLGNVEASTTEPDTGPSNMVNARKIMGSLANKIRFDASKSATWISGSNMHVTYDEFNKRTSKGAMSCNSGRRSGNFSIASAIQSN